MNNNRIIISLKKSITRLSTLWLVDNEFAIIDNIIFLFVIRDGTTTTLSNNAASWSAICILIFTRIVHFCENLNVCNAGLKDTRVLCFQSKLIYNFYSRTSLQPHPALCSGRTMGLSVKTKIVLFAIYSLIFVTSVVSFYGLHGGQDSLYYLVVHSGNINLQVKNEGYHRYENKNGIEFRMISVRNGSFFFFFFVSEIIGAPLLQFGSHFRVVLPLTFRIGRESTWC